MFELSAARIERRKETPGGRSAFFMGNKRGRKDGGGGMLTCLRVRVGREGTELATARYCGQQEAKMCYGYSVDIFVECLGRESMQQRKSCSFPR